jgi:hypothetical protein
VTLGGGAGKCISEEGGWKRGDLGVAEISSGFVMEVTS